MPLPAGTHRLGPENGTLSVRTGPDRRRGDGGARPPPRRHRLEGDAGRSARTRPRRASFSRPTPRRCACCEGTGGMQELGPDDKAGIEQTIDDEILKRGVVTFPLDRGRDRRRREPAAGAGRADARRRRRLRSRSSSRSLPTALCRAAPSVTQSTWGITPYSTLFGALKVADEVEVADRRRSPAARARAAALPYERILPRELKPALLELDGISRVSVRGPPPDLRGLRLTAERAPRQAREARPNRAGTR